ncbi:MAG: UDP-glucose 4-epimerase GalE [Saprospiraceae bacterium]|nr:UDP-glucose 4-epimerase GalE [Saprospiraceae bacterium]
MTKILVTGGAGYIGSHTIIDLISAGYDVVSVDNFINSSVETFSKIKEITDKTVTNFAADLCDYEKLEEVFQKNKFAAVIHFAALKSVGDSVADPLLYYHNNLLGLINLLKLQAKYGVKNLIFSSSCSVYGNADKLPVTEETPLKEAESPYARTKQICEEIIMDFQKVNPDFRSVILRYFNPAGAHSSNMIGESPHNKANNLVPIITETAIGKREKLAVFGDDYPTRDGTCIRDFIHIMDLANAHTRSVEFLLSGKATESSTIINLGSGTGSTVLEVIHSFEKVSGQKLNYMMAHRREGDVIAVYADYSKAKRLLGWVPERDLDTVMDTAWKWELKRNETQDR